MNGTIRDRMHGEREGFALTAAVIALVLVGALVTGGFFAASQENRITDSSHYAERALLVAEYGANDAAGTQRTETLNALPLHTSVTYKLPVDAGPGVDDTAFVEIRRMQGDVGDPTGLFFIRSTGRVYGGRPRRSDEPRPERSVAILVRTSTFDFHHHAALVSLNPTEIKGNARVSGHDAVSDRWDESACPSTNKGSVPGVVAKSEGDVTYKKGDAVTGNPAVFEDPYMTPADFLVFGDWTYEELAARATKVFPHGSNPKPSPSLTADGLCDRSDPLNWGAPQLTGSGQPMNHPCEDYFPIIHARGNVRINANAYGQGILLVDGDLNVMGGFEFNGIVIVRGALETGAGNTRINGMIMVLGDTFIDGPEDNKIAGTPVVNYSSCALERAILNNDETGWPERITDRSWVDLTSSGVTGA